MVGRESGPMAANRPSTGFNMTRRERYLLRRRRYLYRRSKMYQRGWNYVLSPSATLPGHPLTPHRAGRRTPLWNGDKQGPCGVLSRSYDATMDADAQFPGVTFDVSPSGPTKPPHVKLTGAWRLIVDSYGDKHFKLPLIGYHARRRNWVGRKPDRMTGVQRQTWGAGFFAINNGYFPDWDPLHRHPNEADILGGAPTYAGPYPQTPR